MKTYILLFLTFISIGFSSCTNDDIIINYTTNFKINPSGVISPFTYEINTGELESFDSSYKLRIRLLIYNSLGNLVASDVQYFTNYASIMNSSLGLEKGDYTAIATTDVVRYNGQNVTFSFWSLTDSTYLANTKITDNGKIGYQYKILGISKLDFSVVGASKTSETINVKPAGALSCVYYAKMRTYSDVVSYGLGAAKTSESCHFDSQGNYQASAENNNGSYDWWLDHFDIEDFSSSVNNVYSYVFTLPMSNLNLKFQANTSSDQYDLSNPMTISPQAGEEYLFYIDLSQATNNYAISFGQVNSSSSVKNRVLGELSDTSFSMAGNTPSSLYFKNIK